MDKWKVSEKTIIFLKIPKQQSVSGNQYEL